MRQKLFATSNCEQSKCKKTNTTTQVIKMEVTMATKNEILAQLYAIKAGLSIISQEKDKIAKQESILQNIDNDLNRAKAELSRYTESARQLEQQVDDFESRLANPSLSHVKKTTKEAPVKWGILVAGFIIGMILPITIGAMIGGMDWFEDSAWVAWVGGFAGIGLATPIHISLHKKAQAKADAQAEEEYQKALQRERQHQTAQIKKQLDNYKASLSANKQHQESWQNKVDELTDKFNLQYAIYTEQKDLSLGVAKTVYDALIAEYATVLDPRDWKNIDFIIFYYETGRVDTIKEALIHVDKQRQTETIANAIKQASQEISSTINTSMVMLRADLNTCFGALSTQLDKSMQIQLQALEQSNVALGALSGSVSDLGSKLQTSLSALGNEQALTNALLDKVATSSDTLVNDLNYVMGYKAPYYLKK